MTISLSNLQGGHSGAEIDKNRANANKLMGRFLYGLKKKRNMPLFLLQADRKTMPLQESAPQNFLRIPLLR